MFFSSKSVGIVLSLGLSFCVNYDPGVRCKVMAGIKLLWNVILSQWTGIYSAQGLKYLVSKQGAASWSLFLNKTLFCALSNRHPCFTHPIGSNGRVFYGIQKRRQTDSYPG